MSKFSHFGITWRLLFILFIAILMGNLMSCKNTEAAYYHAFTNTNFPNRIASLKIEDKVIDYEKERPGLGISIGYNGYITNVTIYIYNMGIKNIPYDLYSDLSINAFNDAKEEIWKAENMDVYSNVHKVLEGEIKYGDLKFLCSIYRLDQDEYDRISYIYLTIFKNHFLKIRYTYDLSEKKYGEKIMENFFDELNRVLYK